MEPGSFQIVSAAVRMEPGSFQIVSETVRMERGSFRIVSATPRMEPGSFRTVSATLRIEPGRLRTVSATLRMEPGRLRIVSATPRIEPGSFPDRRVSLSPLPPRDLALGRTEYAYLTFPRRTLTVTFQLVVGRIETIQARFSYKLAEVSLSETEEAEGRQSSVFRVLEALEPIGCTGIELKRDATARSTVFRGHGGSGGFKGVVYDDAARSSFAVCAGDSVFARGPAPRPAH
jgi:hypothetical protein